MTLKTRIAFIERLQFFDRKEPSKRHHGIEADRGMSLGKDETVAARPARFFRLNVHSAKEQTDQKVHRGHWPADMAGAATRDGTQHEPTAAAGKLFQFRVVRISVHLINGSR
jgi:hypothetical protein